MTLYYTLNGNVICLTERANLAPRKGDVVEIKGNYLKVKNVVWHISDIEMYDRYIFYPPDYNDFFNECFEEAQARVRETIVQKLYDDMMNAYQSTTNT